LERALYHGKEEHHAIIFLFKADKQKYSKLVEEMKNESLNQEIIS